MGTVLLYYRPIQLETQEKTPKFFKKFIMFSFYVNDIM